MTPEEQARFEALERRIEELERRVLPKPKVRVEAARPLRPVPHRELTFGLNWLSRIAVVTVTLALAFFFEYAFENRWITESGRVLLGLACGAAAFGAGEVFFRRGQRAYGQALAAAGAGFFYLSLWAAFGLYHLVPQLAAFALMILTTAAAGYLAFRYDSLAVALLGLAGGFATPLLLRSGDQPSFVLSYALVLSAGAAFAARSRGRRWQWPEALAVVGTAVLYVSQAPARPFYALFIVASYALFAASESVDCIRRGAGARRGRAGNDLGARRDRACGGVAALGCRTRDRRPAAACRGCGRGVHWFLAGVRLLAQLRGVHAARGVDGGVRDVPRVAAVARAGAARDGYGRWI